MMTAAWSSSMRLTAGLVQRKTQCFRLLSRAISTSRVRERVITSKFPDVHLSEKDYFSFVFSNMKDKADRIALVDGITDESLTYSDCHRQAKNFALSLLRMGAKRGDIMALLLPNCLQYPVVFAGSAAIGVTVTTLNPAYTATEVQKQLAIADASFVVTTEELLPKLELAEDRLGHRETIHIMMVGENSTKYQSVEELLNDDLDGEIDSSVIDVHKDICALPFSSGTTGMPKGVMLSHFNIVGNICQTAYAPPEIQLIKPPTDTYQSSTISVLPLYHAFALNVTMGPSLFGGGQMVIMPKFDPATFVRAMERHKPTYLHLAPPLVSFLASHPSVTPDHLSCLEHVFVAAAPSGPSLIAKFKSKAPHGVVYREGWGMSETSPIVLVTPQNDEINGSCGVVVPNTEVKVIDVTNGETLGPNQRGELCVKGPQNMVGYFNDPEATRRTISDNWLHTGDVAIFDEGEHFYIVDRLKELIKVKGFQVAPAELEDLLRSHEAVQDVAVIGIPHEKFGEAPRAYVVVRESHSLSKEILEEFMAENAAPYKQLVGGIEFVSEIPKSPAGKILRKDILKMYVERQRQ